MRDILTESTALQEGGENVVAIVCTVLMIILLFSTYIIWNPRERARIKKWIAKKSV